MLKSARLPTYPGSLRRGYVSRDAGRGWLLPRTRELTTLRMGLEGPRERLHSRAHYRPCNPNGTCLRRAVSPPLARRVLCCDARVSRALHYCAGRGTVSLRGGPRRRRGCDGRGAPCATCLPSRMRCRAGRAEDCVTAVVAAGAVRRMRRAHSHACFATPAGSPASASPLSPAGALASCGPVMRVFASPLPRGERGRARRVLPRGCFPAARARASRHAGASLLPPGG